MKSKVFNPYILILTVAVVGLLFWMGCSRLEIDTDIINGLPRDPIIQDALQVFKNHEIQDQLAVDVSLDKADVGRLIEYGRMLEERLRASGLFKSVGFQDFGKVFPALASTITKHLPLLFTEKELMEQVRPLAEPTAVRSRLGELHRDLMNLEGIGQAEFIENDPLGLSRLVMARLASLAPSRNAYFQGDRLISSDHRHLLVVGTPMSSATDTALSRKLAALMDTASEELGREASLRKDRLTLTPLGAYRFALDNELIASRDVKRAVLFSTIGIALLLLLAFPRPYIGLLSLLPSIAGTMSAYFVFSLFHKSISIMVLGFGGAIISMTVDNGIAYFLFLDRTQWSFGKDVSREVFSVCLLALLTTIGAFAALSFSGFPILSQLGEFTFFGMSLSFIFVHLVSPFIFPSIPPAKPRALPLQRVVDRLFGFGWKGAAAALCFALIMLFFAKPEFKVNLSSMNTVSKETGAAEKLFSDVWGNVLSKVFLMISAGSPTELRNGGDRLLDTLDREISSGGLNSGFVPSMIFPGETRAASNLSAWRAFWSADRVSALRTELESSSEEIGFAASAFEPFYKTLESSWVPEGDLKIPEELYGFLGIKKSPDGSSWMQVMTFTTGKAFNSDRFYAAHHSTMSIFDPDLFSKTLGRLLFSTFLKMLLMVGAGVIVLVLLYFADLTLTIVSMLPVIFAFICTLGTLKFLGYPLGIATLMLPIVEIGMGTDFPLYIIRSYQRYRRPSHPSFSLIRLTVFMAAATTLVGFCTLWSAEHNLLKSVGVTSALAMGYAALGAFLILPPVMERLLRRREEAVSRKGSPLERVLGRFRELGPYPRFFARFKLKLDPMFKELPALMRFCPGGVRTIVDIGSGYGIPACWFLEWFPDSAVYGIEPDSGRLALASRALGRRGAVVGGRAPEMPDLPGPADLAMLLDMVHYLDDDGLRLTLERLKGSLVPGGIVILRMALAPQKKFSWKWWMENQKLKARGIPAYYRSVEEMRRKLTEAGLTIEHTSMSGSDGELIWFVLRTAD